MSSPFIPFLVVNPNTSAGPVSNRAEGRPPAGNAFIPVVASSAAPLAKASPNAGPAPLAMACSDPLVTLQKDGDRVTHIRIQCACGQVVELACAY
ncbi:MAG: hypothetical protein V9H26_25995 [Verrucomicrobiota bacterium]|nr:hypothetical protein [Verrucomicrobiota bacterium]MCC6820442.1 hypothetical protein [Limisphaerales bacterium]